MLLSYLLSSSTPPDPATFLSAAELAHLASLRFAKRRDEFLLGRWAAKRLLVAAVTEFTALDPSSLTIENEPSGAPVVLTPSGEAWTGCLSISHRAGTAFCALTSQPKVSAGADLERVEPRSEAFIQDYLSASEVRGLEGLSSAARECRVVLCWSAKEALLKALRIGLRADTRQIELLRADEPEGEGWAALGLRSDLPGTQGARGWWSLRGDLLLTLAIIGTDEPVEFREME